jgi:hypothetical protein
MDEVRTQDDERLDRNDFEGVQTLVYDAMRALAGGVVGDGGVLAGMEIDASTLATTTIGKGIFLESETVESPPISLLGRALLHDPAAAWQSGLSTINLAGVEPATPFIWARRELVDHDFAARRSWDGLLGDEVALPQNTRRRSRVVFGVGNTAPDGSPGWTQIARVAAWAGGVPTIYRIHAFDLFYSGTATNRESSISLLFDLFEVIGLSPVLSTIVGQLHALIGGANWITSPSVSLSTLEQYFADIDANGFKLLVRAEVHATADPEDWSFDLVQYVARNEFGGPPSYVPPPAFQDDVISQTWQVPGRARHVVCQRINEGANLTVPMEFRVSDLVYNESNDSTLFFVSQRKTSDGSTTYGSYHLLCFGNAQTEQP